MLSAPAPAFRPNSHTKSHHDCRGAGDIVPNSSVHFSAIATHDLPSFPAAHVPSSLHALPPMARDIHSDNNQSSTQGKG
jgi:hypothetical protein